MDESRAGKADVEHTFCNRWQTESLTRLEGVVIARRYSLLEYNIPRERLAEAENITPGFKSPTITSLEDSDWCAVRVMVKTKQVTSVMDQLEELGASAILETPINNCRL